MGNESWNHGRDDPRSLAAIRGEGAQYDPRTHTTPAFGVNPKQPEPEKGMAIRDALAHHEQAMTELFKVLDVLEHRIDPILTPPQDSTGAAVGQSGNARAASELHARADQLRSGTVMAIQRIMAIVDRIEL